MKKQTNRNPNVSMSFKEISKKLNISEDEVKSIYKSAIKKIKHPRVGKKVKDYLGVGAMLENNGF